MDKINKIVEEMYTLYRDYEDTGTFNEVCSELSSMIGDKIKNNAIPIENLLSLECISDNLYSIIVSKRKDKSKYGL